MESPVKNGSRKNKTNFVSKTWARIRSKSKKKVAPAGFFPVYVGPEKQWFAMEMKYLNDPLFWILLEDAEIEYGFQTPGPILLPCEVDIFYRVLAEMDAKEMKPAVAYAHWFNPMIRRFQRDQMAKGYGGYGALTPSRLVIKMD